MHSHWAAEHLLVIRTLMERSAIYRRALAPIVLGLGVLGMVGAFCGAALAIEKTRPFVGYWSAVGLLGVSGAYLLARRQALKVAESFWSAPTRRVTQALLPPLFGGFVAGLVAMLQPGSNGTLVWWLLPTWMLLYGCAVHAAGFFMPRGMKLFGWIFIVGACALALWLGLANANWPTRAGHWLMGASFGGFHLGYGIYLSFTEKNNHAA